MLFNISMATCNQNMAYYLLTEVTKMLGDNLKCHLKYISELARD